MGKVAIIDVVRTVIPLLLFAIAFGSPAAKAATFSPASFEGVVTLHRDGDPYFFATASDGSAWRAEVTRGDPFPNVVPGDIVKVSGMREDDINRPRLFDAKWTLTGHDESKMPRPRRMTVGELYETATDPTGDIPDWYAHYLEVEGVVRDINRRVAYTQIQIGDGADTIQLSIRVDSSVSMPEHLAIGAKVSCLGCGVYTLVRDREKKFLRVNTFAVMVQGFDSLRVLTRPPWWTPGRKWAAVGLAAFVILMLCVWVALLTRAVRAERAAAGAISAERRRMAADLHDTIEQHLAGVKILLSTAAECEGVPKKALDTLQSAEEMLAHAKGEVRAVVMDLRDDGVGSSLEDSLHEIASGVARSGSVRVKTALLHLPKRFSRRDRQNLIMIVREAVTNAMKHGKPKNVAIVSDPSGRGFVLQVLNDGEAFDFSAALGPETGHYGLSGMRERAERSRFELSFVNEAHWRGVRIKVNNIKG